MEKPLLCLPAKQLPVFIRPENVHSGTIASIKGYRAEQEDSNVVYVVRIGEFKYPFIDINLLQIRLHLCRWR